MLLCLLTRKTLKLNNSVGRVGIISRRYDMIKTFLKLGISAFGGPAAHIAMLQDEAVSKHEWLTQEEFLSLNSITNIIPGPNSSEMVLGVGYYVGGIKGLLKAGIAFMTPSILIVMAISIFFKEQIHQPWIQVALNGMKPVLVIMIAQVFIKFFQSGITSKAKLGVFIFGGILVYLGLSELGLILITGLGFAAHFFYRKKSLSVEPISLMMIFTLFLKIGATLYGSGYVLLSYLETTFLKYMNQQDIINAFLIGEITPGPVFTSATAVGVFLAGPLGGLIATLGIFIPSFILMILIMPIKQKVTKIDWIQYVLQGINVASVVLIAKVLVSLSISSLMSMQALILLGIILLLKFKFKLNQYALLAISPVLNIVLNAFLA